MEDNFFAYDPTGEDAECGHFTPPKGKHLVLLDNGTYKWIPNDEIEF